MSTKASLAWDHEEHSFHFYREMGDDDHVYLELRDKWKCCNIKIPIDIWETIRKVPVLDFTKADRTDEDILTAAKVYALEIRQSYDKCLEEGCANSLALALYGNETVEEMTIKEVEKLMDERSIKGNPVLGV